MKMIIIRQKVFSDVVFEEKLFRNKANRVAEHERLLNNERARAQHSIQSLDRDIAAQGGKDSFGYLSSLQSERANAAARLEKLNNPVGTGKTGLEAIYDTGEFKRINEQLRSARRAATETVRENKRAGRISEEGYKRFKEDIDSSRYKKFDETVTKLEDARSAQNNAIKRQRSLQRGGQTATHVKDSHGGRTRYKLANEQAGGYQEALNDVLQKQGIDPSLSYMQSVRNDALKAVKEQKLKNLTPEQRKRFEALSKQRKETQKKQLEEAMANAKKEVATMQFPTAPTTTPSVVKNPTPSTPLSKPVTTTAPATSVPAVTTTPSKPVTPRTTPLTSNSNTQKQSENFISKNAGRVKRLFNGTSKYGKAGQIAAIGGTALAAAGTAYGAKKLHDKKKNKDKE